LGGAGIEYYLSNNEITQLKETIKKYEESGVKLEPELNVYNWYDYTAPDIVEDFSDEFSVKVNYSTYGSPDEMFAKVKVGGSGLDVVVASDYKVGELIPLNTLRKLDYTKIPNFKYISEKFRKLLFDLNQEYSVPYMWGTTGIGYNSQVVTDEFEGFEIIFDEDKISKYSKKVVLVDEMREVFAAALKHLGYSLNDTDEAHLNQAKDLIMKIKPYLLKFSAEQVKELLISGDAVLALGYSTDVYLASFQDENIHYKIADKGGTLWIDNFVLLDETKNPNSAHRFIDYMSRPAVSAINSNYLYLANPDFTTKDRGYIFPDIAEDPNIYPPDETLNKLEVFRPYTVEEKDRMGKLWSEIRA
jgi:spermidine/putrescine transport system substrate-binding protein